MKTSNLWQRFYAKFVFYPTLAWNCILGRALRVRNWWDRVDDHVIVGDVDEIVAVDPQAGKNLLEFLQSRRPNRVFTPLGMEVIHRIDVEPDPILPIRASRHRGTASGAVPTTRRQ